LTSSPDRASGSTKPSPVPDEVTQPYWDACNEGRLVVQNCTACSRLQHPPQKACYKCGSENNLGWREMSGRGKVHGYCVSYDSRVMILQEIQPFNLVVIELDEDPDIKMLSHLPGTPTSYDKNEVKSGTPVQVVFETTYNGQKVAEWQVVA